MPTLKNAPGDLVFTMADGQVISLSEGTTLGDLSRILEASLIQITSVTHDKSPETDPERAWLVFVEHPHAEGGLFATGTTLAAALIGAVRRMSLRCARQRDENLARMRMHGGTSPIDPDDHGGAR